MRKIKYAVIQIQPEHGSYGMNLEVMADGMNDIKYAERVRAAYLEISDDVPVSNIQVIQYATD